MLPAVPSLEAACGIGTLSARAEGSGEEGRRVALVRRGWRRVRTSLADEVALRVQEALGDYEARERERFSELVAQLALVLAQLSDVFKELALISEANGEMRGALGSMDERLSAGLAELGDTVEVSLDVDNQSTELLGRLLASARARLEALEEAVHPPS